MFQKFIKTAQDGLRRLPQSIARGVKVFNDTRQKVQKALPQIEEGISKSRRIYDEVVKPSVSGQAQGRAEKIFNFANQTVDRIKQADSAVERTKKILNQ